MVTTDHGTGAVGDRGPGNSGTVAPARGRFWGATATERSSRPTTDTSARQTSVGSTRHVAGLDGIRGLAVAAVVAYHLGFGWARGGYLGVDSFLVLSGYLITSGLLGEHERTATVRLGAFWGRRARRLLPALLLLLGAAAAYATLVALPDEAHSLRMDSLSALGFFSNWRFVVTSQGYFGQTAAPSLLRHTWSLAVEGQLYVVWPLVVMVVLRRGGRRALAAASVVLAVASAGLAIVLASGGADVTRAYYGTDTRAAAFLFGAAVAVAPAGRWLSGRVVAICGVSGIVASAVLWATLSGTSTWLFRGGLPLAAVATAAAVACVVGRPAGLIGRALSVPPLRLLGRVSYGIYLWHWPLLLILDHRRTGLSGMALVVLRLGATAVATATSWVVVERPVLRLGPRRVPRRWQPALAAALCVVVGGAVAVPAAVAGPSGAGLSSNVASAALLPGVSAPLAAGQEPAGDTSSGTSGANGATSSGQPRPLGGAGQPGPAGSSGPASPPDPSGGTGVVGPSGASVTEPPPVADPPVRSLLLGDSVALTLGNAIGHQAPSYNVHLENNAILGCGVTVGSALRTTGTVGQVPGRCQAWEQSWKRDVDVDHSDVVTLVLGRWEVLDRLIGGRWRHVGEPVFDAYLADQLDRGISIAASDGGAVIVCTSPYFSGAERPGGGAWPENDPARVDRFNELAREAVARHPGVVLFDLNALVSPGGHFASVIDGKPVRSADGIHFSYEGGAYVADQLYTVMVAAGRPSGQGPHGVLEAGP